MFDNDLFYHCHREAVELLLIEDAGHESVDKVEDHGEQLVAFLLRAGVADMPATRS